ncbi:MAG TPA: hypothetical protein VF621_11120 [Pyrinomonadaceae bacterium]
MFEHHLIVGDFGREGTLRYFSEFSRAEREVVSASLSAPFFDEHRRVRYSIVGLLRDIKKEFIAEYGRAGRPLDEGVLVGVRGGLKTDDILDSLVGCLAPWFLLALTSGASRVKVIVPCNTLAPLLSTLEESLRDLDRLKHHLRRGGAQPAAHAWELFEATAERAAGVAVSAPSIMAAVVDELEASPPARLAVFGTDIALACYREELRRRKLDTEVIDYSEVAHYQAAQVINASVGGVTQLPCLAHEAADGLTVLSACTDVGIDGALDSTLIFARRMAAAAYEVAPPSADARRLKR